MVELNMALCKEESIGNDFDLSKSHLCIITGADQGGKTSFLISVGQAQVLMQCGMPAGAKKFQAPIAAGVFTHFQKDEDRTMRNGKLNEELIRMSRIIDQIRPSSLMLFDESFCSTNEREGSRIALDITHALLATHIDIFSVRIYTHMQKLYMTNQSLIMLFFVRNGWIVAHARNASFPGSRSQPALTSIYTMKFSKFSSLQQRITKHTA